jgi:hypothetical protein
MPFILSVSKYADMVYACGFCDVNAVLATAEYQRRFPYRIIPTPVAYPGILFGRVQLCSRRGVQQIQLRTEGRENGDLGGDSPLVRGSAQFANE